MREGKIEEADEVMKRWSYNPDTEMITSHEMENTWYSILKAKAFISKGNYLEGFKYLNIIERSVNAQYDDSYEFHLYTI